MDLSQDATTVDSIPANSGAATAVRPPTVSATTRPRRGTFVISFILLGLPYAVLALQPPLEVTLGAAAFAGLAAGPLNPILGTVAQERVPAELRGRVFGAITAGALMAMPAGVLLGGYLTDQFGVQPVFFGIAACYLAVTLSMLFNRSLREMNAPAPASKPAVA